MIEATFINLNDNVRYNRVYKSRGRFISAVKRLKGAIFENAVDHQKLELITAQELYGALHGNKQSIDAIMKHR